MTETKLPPIVKCAFCGYGEYVVDRDWVRAMRRRAEHEEQCNETPFPPCMVEPDEAQQCGKPQAPDGWAYQCTRRAGHIGMHAAHAPDKSILATWPWNIRPLADHGRPETTPAEPPEMIHGEQGGPGWGI